LNDCFFRQLHRAAPTQAIYEAGFNSNGRFYAGSSKMLGMKPKEYREGGAGNTIRFAIAESSPWGSSSTTANSRDCNELIPVRAYPEPAAVRGIANYYGPHSDPPREAQGYLEGLLTTIPWKNDEAVIRGKHIVTARKAAWYGETANKRRKFEHSPRAG
jgi:hypothetical protein